ncbi:hypothetical protein LPW11_09885 [Geomonas sp. RF6]|uniref:hypothetical protein n=1 Tax=Geomonas sp. RF6 TaxID=2897342 RepID=UPI001E28840B|nr:hypothetical protein [Geomonas sp. RF6]UFS72484.1 hypothetical protein LPW11_09885 [Geomonas sp. RF6]
MAERTAVEITPLDIRGIRQALGFSQKQMGEHIATHAEGPGSTPVPGSRVNEWETHVRAVPDYVFVACARMLVDIWARIRGGKSDKELNDVDSTFAGLLSPALASIIRFEGEFRGRRDKEGLCVHAHSMKIRRDVQCHFESLLMIDLAKVLG